jgi:hypothetical protein
MGSKRAGSTPSFELAEIVVGLRNMLKLEVTTASGQSLPQNVLLDLAVPWKKKTSVQGETREGTRTLRCAPNKKLVGMVGISINEFKLMGSGVN